MIFYSKSIKEFCNEVSNIDLILNNILKKQIYKYSGISEIKSWKNSLKYFSDILLCSNLDPNTFITLEYNLPLTLNRIDLIITGYNNKKPVVIVFELKQWNTVNDVENSDFMVRTILNGSLQDVIHPGYQVWSYVQMLKDYNLYIQENKITILPCIIMHNYKYREKDIMLQKKYRQFMNNVAYFGIGDEDKLINFLKNNITHGDSGKIINDIDSSKIKPSIKLQNEINELINNNSFFNLIDQQIVIFDKVLSKINQENNNVFIIKGKPGTGKSILAINLLNKFINDGKSCQYVSRNTAPRVVYSKKLKGKMKKNSIDYLFRSSGSYTRMEKDIIDVLIVDEAHCLTEKSGLFSNYGENQILEIISSSKNSIFFIDEKQKVHINDIGTIRDIENMAIKNDKKVYKLSLDYQFRCNGSNDYLDFVDYILGTKKSFNEKTINYDFRLINTPDELLKIIKEKNKNNNFSRVVAGYCWNWNKKEMNNPNYYDIKINNFEMSWNLGQEQTFVIDDSINEAGCIHSVQGLEFDYVGVIIGKDLIFENGLVVSKYNNHGSADPSFKGIKKIYKEDPIYAEKLADELIKNAYRVLLTRGTKGCYIYCEDDNYRSYIEGIISKINFKK